MAEGYPGTDDYLIKALKKLYIGDITTPKCTIEYTGIENAESDAPKKEVFAATQAANHNSAPELDVIPNPMIRNLSNEMVKRITKVFNEQCWSQGQVTPQWKEAKIITMTKPGKKLVFETLRLISLTSCMKKL